MQLLDYLERKPLYYTEIDYTRMPRVYEKIRSCFSNKNVIHLVGTNGKGTTGRFLATALKNVGFSVGHYTSPHIDQFNERIWMDGSNVSYERLEQEHLHLQKILTPDDADSLSYFEYTTLLAMLVLDGCDYIVCEAGLGGRHDATAVFEKRLTLVTPIGFDHQDFLGSTIEEIALEKLSAIQNNAILAAQKYSDVHSLAEKLALQKGLNIVDLDAMIQKEDEEKIAKISAMLSLQSYLVQNLKLSIAALHFLSISYQVENFQNSLLFGRLTKFKPNIILDVGHNPLAAQSLTESLQNQKFILIYNTYKDKDYPRILKILKPLIKHIEIIDVNDARIESFDVLKKVLNDIEIEYRPYKMIRDDQNYLVFGSFKVIEMFLKSYNE